MNGCGPARARLAAVLAGLSCLLALPAMASGDGYEQMLGYLTSSRISDQALAGAQGSIKLNLAAGDLNAQHNAHALAIGKRAVAGVASDQPRSDNRYQAPDQSHAHIGGQVLAAGSGVASINQASGSGNAQLNALGSALGAQAQASVQHGPLPQAPALRTAAQGIRRAAIEASALRGFEGVLQINQIAGSANLAENRLGLLVQTGP